MPETYRSDGAAQQHSGFFLLLIVCAGSVCIFVALKNYVNKLRVNFCSGCYHHCCSQVVVFFDRLW